MSGSPTASLDVYLRALVGLAQVQRPRLLSRAPANLPTMSRGRYDDTMHRVARRMHVDLTKGVHRYETRWRQNGMDWLIDGQIVHQVRGTAGTDIPWELMSVRVIIRPRNKPSTSPPAHRRRRAAVRSPRLALATNYATAHWPPTTRLRTGHQLHAGRASSSQLGLPN